MLSRGSDMTLLAHRGSYKTTCLTLVMAIHLITRPRENMLFLRKTDRDSQEVLRQVQQILATPAMQTLSAALWGRPVGIRRATLSGLTTDVYAAPRGAAQLTALGCGSTLTGRHGEMIFTDDIVNLRDRLSWTEREHTRQVYMELQNVRTPGGRIVNIGTPWHPEDALSLMPAPWRWDCHRTKLLSPAELDSLRRSMSPSLFAANYELQHIAREDALLDTSPVFCREMEVDDLMRDSMAHLDAAYGGEDYTALTIGRETPLGWLFYGRLWQRHVQDVLPEVEALTRRFLAAPLYVETNGDKGYLARELRNRGVAVRPYREGMNKHLKIATHLRQNWSRMVFHPETDRAYLAQIMDYTENAPHDDAPDSAASLCRILAHRR